MRYLPKIIFALLGFALIVSLLGCPGPSDNGAPIYPDTEKSIDSFSINGVQGTIDHNGGTITLSLDYAPGLDPTDLSPAITYTGTSVSPSSGTSADFSGGPVPYTVIAEDGSSKVYNVSVSIIYQIIIGGLSHGDISASPSVSAKDRPVTLTAEPETGYALDTASLIVENMSTHTYLSVSENNNLYSFTMPASNVTVSAQFKDTRKSIDSFSIGGVQGTIDHNAGTITLSLDYGYDPAALTPIISYTGTSVSPSSGTSADFSGGPVPYTVIAEDGSSKVNNVSVGVKGQASVIINAPYDYGSDIVFSGIANPMVLSKSGGSAPASVTVTINGDYDDIKWYVNGEEKPADPGASNELTINASAYPIRMHSLTALVYRGTVPYSQILPFEVKQ